MGCLEEGSMYDADVPHVAKVLELIGSSPSGWEDAVANAVKEAAKSIHDIKGVYLKECTAKVDGDKIVEYRAVVKVSFVVERET